MTRRFLYTIALFSFPGRSQTSIGKHASFFLVRLQLLIFFAPSDYYGPNKMQKEGCRIGLSLKKSIQYPNGRNWKETEHFSSDGDYLWSIGLSVIAPVRIESTSKIQHARFMYAKTLSMDGEGQGRLSSA